MPDSFNRAPCPSLQLMPISDLGSLPFPDNILIGLLGSRIGPLSLSNLPQIYIP